MVQRREDVSANEALAIRIIEAHPEFHLELKDEEPVIGKTYGADETNPFLHLSLHLTVHEQVSADMPPGMSTLFKRLTVTCHSEHAAEHVLSECINNAIARASKDKAPLDPQQYLAEVEEKLAALRERH